MGTKAGAWSVSATFFLSSLLPYFLSSSSSFFFVFFLVNFKYFLAQAGVRAGPCRA